MKATSDDTDVKKVIPSQMSLGRAATSGVIWLIAQGLSARLLGFFSQLILAALLMPADFGIIGLANTVTGIAQTLVGFGVDDVLLQRHRTMRMWSAPAFWISLTLGTVGMILMMAAAPFAGRIYHSHSIVGLIVILALAMPIRTLATVPMVQIRLAMNFRFMAAYNTFEIAALQLGTIILAWIGLGALSFVIPVPILALIKAGLFWRKASPAIWRRFRLVQLYYMLGNSSIVFASRTIIEVVNQGDYIVLGLIASHNVVGLYYFAFRLSVQPVRMLAGNFTSVLFPALAQLRSDPIRQTEAALRASRLLGYLVVPFCFLQAALAGPGLELLFGKRWLGAIPIVQLLSIGLPFDAVSWITGSLLSARREFSRSLLYAAISAPLFFGAVILGGWIDGAIGVAAAVVVFYTIYPPICSILILRDGGVRVGQVLELYVVPLVLAGSTTLIAYGASLLPPVSHSNIARIVVIGTLSAILYPAALYAVRRDVFLQIATRFNHLAAKLGIARAS
ncbi:MAG: oligosaccharide flippase family protein [Janthinobacterium lividum]